ncbi:hypothetical protein [Clostridium gasigenes]|uniref:Energy-coupling factor transport system substrate-specific component n=1 Tax=Clostridium gasigenes TaxID=94869 RepID=A0A7X0SGD3_9CLOT|nr:hypothetical protein [Clostridium gasigenes]MBB6715853.1 hypothetical protein [Clostridium gasigenes]
MRNNLKTIILMGVLGAILVVSQIALNFIPNVELVSLLLIIFTLIYEKKALYIVFVFVISMGLMYGFGLWWIGYLIIWPALVMITYTFKNKFNKNFLGLAIFSAGFGLIFGALYAIPYIFTSGMNVAIAYWIRGIPFDLIHMVGNYFAMILLGERIYNLLLFSNKKYGY